VAFRYNDTQDHDRWKVMRLKVEEFIRRFLLHVLPKGLVRIRHYGFLANACRSKQLPRIRQAIAAAAGVAEAYTITQIVPEAWSFTCPSCHRPMRIVAAIPTRWEGG